MPLQTALPTRPSTQSAAGITRFVGRQPILDRNQRVFGYELLFRSSLDNWADLNSESISLQVMDDMLSLGLDTVAPGAMAFVNCNRQVLIEETITLLPAQTTVVEVLETVADDDEIVAACRHLKDLGYRIALDDFLPGHGSDRLVELADFIKLDFRASTPERNHEMQLLLRRKTLDLVAEKVETEEEFNRARDDGFSHFQGYFFARPTILQGRTIPPNQVIYIQLLDAVSTSPLDIDRVEKLVMAETSLCFRLLRMVNSPNFTQRDPVTSVRHALMLLGEDRMRKLITIAAATSLGEKVQACSQLVLLSLHRARFCELLAQRILQIPGEQYLIGLLSPVDAILHVPMETIVKMLPLRPPASAALLDQDGPVSGPLQLVQAFERCDGKLCARLCAQLNLSETEASAIFVESLQWANRELGASAR